MLDRSSFLLITLDSCRFDTFNSARAPHLKGIGPLYRAIAPGYFTYSSHAAMFVGFTPGVATLQRPYVNPKYGKIFRMLGGASSEGSRPFVTLGGCSIIDGFSRLGYATIGTGAVAWFDPQTPTGQLLTRDFAQYYYPGDTYSLDKQLEWVSDQVHRSRQQPVFVFMNIGETHVPYYHKGAPWELERNPCVPFGKDNDAEECRRRQTACLEFIDARLAGLLQEFRNSNVLLCADHGDAWGEDDLWAHGFHHEKVLEVPMAFRLTRSPTVSSNGAAGQIMTLFRRLAKRLRRPQSMGASG